MPNDWPAWLLAVALASVPATLYSIARVIEALNQRTLPMAVLAAFQPVLDELAALPDAIAAKVASAGGTLPEGAASAQDVTDTLAAVQAASDAAKAAAS